MQGLMRLRRYHHKFKNKKLLKDGGRYSTFSIVLDNGRPSVMSLRVIRSLDDIVERCKVLTSKLDAQGFEALSVAIERKLMQDSHMLRIQTK
jgi:hypothetical protein